MLASASSCAAVTRAITVAALALLPISSPSQARTFQVSTRSGVPVRVMREASWNKSCQPTGGPNYSFDPPPAHGTVATRSESKVISTCDAGGCECKGHTVSGPALYNTPERSFKGVDQFGVTSTFPNGVSLSHQATVTVR